MAINYQFDVINPFQAALQGYGAGAQILQQERAAASEQAQMAQRNQLFALQMQEAQARAAQVQQEMAAAEERNKVYGEFYDAVEAGKLTPQLVAKVTAVDEKLGTFGADLMANMTAEQKRNNFANLMAPASALATGDVEAAKANLQTQYDALVNSGDEQGATVVKGYLDQLGTKDGQTLVQASLLRAANMMDPEGFAKQLENIQAIKKAPFEAQLAELEVEKTQAQILRDRAAANLDNYRRSDEANTGQRVQSSKAFNNGAVLNVMTDGTTVVRNPQGEVVQGPEAARVLDEANKYETDIQQGRAGARAAGTISQNIAKDAFVSLNKVQSNLANLDRVVEAIDKGAKSGFIESNLPTWDASTIELRNLRAQLGLDVVGSVTFGALSEGELSLALDTALPKDLSPADLRTWVLNKKAAQEKLANYLSEQVRFLSIDPGKYTVGDWLTHLESRARIGAPPGGAVTGAAPRVPVSATPRQRQRPTSE